MLVEEKKEDSDATIILSDENCSGDDQQDGFEKFEGKKKSTKPKKMSESFKTEDWLFDDVLDDFGEKVVYTTNPGVFTYGFIFLQHYLQPYKKYKYKTKILNVNAKPDYLSSLQHLKQKEVQYTYVLFVPLNTNLNNGQHWFLGCIFFPLKRIVIFDSNFSNEKDYSEYFQLLFNIVELCFLLADRNIESIAEWKFSLASSRELPQQSNDFDCGVMMCLYMYAILNNNLKLAKFKDSASRRTRVREILDNFASPPFAPRSHFTLYSPPKISQLTSIYYNVSSSATIVSMLFNFIAKDKCMTCKKGMGSMGNIIRCIACNCMIHILCMQNLEFNCKCKKTV